MTYLKPKKSLGQHFLKDKNIAKKIVGSLSKESVNVFEIGPGTGVLTKYLINEPDLNVLFIETDSDAVEFLKIKFPENVSQIIHADFLKLNINNFFCGNFSIIGNFPYNISSQIFFKILEQKEHINEVVCMIQKEVAERISSLPETKKYGILSVLLQAYFDIEYLFTVNETVFFPPPKVKSAVIRLKRNEISSLECDEKIFFKVVKAAFNQRRKTLRNSLKNFNIDKEKTGAELLGKRAEQLYVKDFVFLVKSIING
jgi:16S rRNA (adenine1518-N6/adenine1519-N6)-dimethyltransferase